MNSRGKSLDGNGMGFRLEVVAGCDIIESEQSVHIDQVASILKIATLILMLRRGFAAGILFTVGDGAPAACNLLALSS